MWGIFFSRRRYSNSKTIIYCIIMYNTIYYRMRGNTQCEWLHGAGMPAKRLFVNTGFLDDYIYIYIYTVYTKYSYIYHTQTHTHTHLNLFDKNCVRNALADSRHIIWNSHEVSPRSADRKNFYSSPESSDDYCKIISCTLINNNKQ